MLIGNVFIAIIAKIIDKKSISAIGLYGILSKILTNNVCAYLFFHVTNVFSKSSIFSINIKDEKDPILLCYEKEGQFCHRHVLAEFINLKYGIYVPDISISEGLEIIEHKKPEYIRQILQKLMEKEVER